MNYRQYAPLHRGLEISGQLVEPFECGRIAQYHYVVARHHGVGAASLNDLARGGLRAVDYLQVETLGFRRQYLVLDISGYLVYEVGLCAHQKIDTSVHPAAQLFHDGGVVCERVFETACAFYLFFSHISSLSAKPSSASNRRTASRPSSFKDSENLLTNISICLRTTSSDSSRALSRTKL